jgi:hypothetical protein
MSTLWVGSRHTDLHGATPPALVAADLGVALGSGIDVTTECSDPTLTGGGLAAEYVRVQLRGAGCCCSTRRSRPAIQSASPEHRVCATRRGRAAEASKVQFRQVRALRQRPPADLDAARTRSEQTDLERSIGR